MPDYQKQQTNSGVQFSLKNLTYYENFFSTTFIATLLDASIDNKYLEFKTNFEKNCWKYNFQKEDFLAEVSFRNDVYKFLGWNTRGRLIAEDSRGIIFLLDKRLSVKKVDGKISFEMLTSPNLIFRR